TALIGGSHDNSGLGAVWVFTRSGSAWTQSGEKLTGGGENPPTENESFLEQLNCFQGQVRFGEAVALSADGKTALIGGPGDNEGDGAAWVFNRAGTIWTQLGEKVTGAGEQNFNEHCCFEHIGGKFGASAALSAHGNTALVGGPLDATAIPEG